MPINKLKKILAEFEKTDAEELEYEDGDLRICIKKGKTHAQSTKPDDTSDYILSPLIGNYYNPAQPIKEGQRVNEGQVLCTIESMKIMNKICAPADMIIKKINFRDGDAVECKSKLFKVDYL